MTTTPQDAAKAPTRFLCSAEWVAERCVEAVLKERERCAGIAERYTDGVYAAEAIRQEPGNTIEQAAQPAQATVTREDDIAAVLGEMRHKFTKFSDADIARAILKLIGQSGEEAVTENELVAFLWDRRGGGSITIANDLQANFTILKKPPAEA